MKGLELLRLFGYQGARDLFGKERLGFDRQRLNLRWRVEDEMENQGGWDEESGILKRQYEKI